MATGLESVLKGAFHSLSDRVEKGSRDRRLERAWDEVRLCRLMRHPGSGAVYRKPRGMKRHEDPREVTQGREWQSLCSWGRVLAPLSLSKLFPSLQSFLAT